MKSLYAVAAVLWTSTSVVYGNFVSESYHVESVHSAIEWCEDLLSCAGVSYRLVNNNSLGDDDDNSTQFEAISHAFVASTDAGVPVPVNENWETYLSNKTFVFQPGRVVSSKVLTDIVFDKNSLTIAQAKKLCLEHPRCIAFTFATHSTSLTGFEEIEFVGSVDHVVDNELDEWRTFVVNDPLKAANLVNLTAFNWDQDWEEDDTSLYRSCCDRAVFDQTTNEPILPTIKELQQVDTLPRISCDISPQEFHDKYEKPRIPVMLVGCDQGWPAQRRWTKEQLAQRFSNDTVWRASREDEGSLSEWSWGELKQDIANKDRFYVFDQLDHDAGRVLEQDYTTPAPFANKDLYTSNFPPNYGSRRWFCLGPKHSGTAPHDDPFATDAWNTVVRGHKWWVLYPSTVKDEETVECSSACSEDDSLAHWYASVGINAARTVYAANGEDSQPMTVLQGPGETIYVPHDYIHSVFNMDDTVAITANYGSRANLDKVWHAMLEEGSDDQVHRFYYERLNAEQRRQVRDGQHWPIEDFRGEDFDEDEDDQDEDQDEDEDDQDADADENEEDEDVDEDEDD